MARTGGSGRHLVLPAVSSIDPFRSVKVFLEQEAGSQGHCFSYINPLRPEAIICLRDLDTFMTSTAAKNDGWKEIVPRSAIQVLNTRGGSKILTSEIWMKWFAANEIAIIRIDRTGDNGSINNDLMSGGQRHIHMETLRVSSASGSVDSDLSTVEEVRNFINPSIGSNGLTLTKYDVTGRAVETDLPVEKDERSRFAAYLNDSVIALSNPDRTTFNGLKNIERVLKQKILTVVESFRYLRAHITAKVNHESNIDGPPIMDALYQVVIQKS